MINIEVGLGDGEVEIFGEPVGLEPALSEAGPTLERPAAGSRVLSDSGEQPPQDVVLFDHVVGELPLPGEVGDLAFGDHADTSALIRRAHRFDRDPRAGSDGSRRGKPEVSGPATAEVSRPRTSSR